MFSSPPDWLYSHSPLDKDGRAADADNRVIKRKKKKKSKKKDKDDVSSSSSSDSSASSHESTRDTSANKIDALWAQ